MQGFKTYAVSDGEYVKIGKATNVSRRLSALQVANARVLVVIAVAERDVEDGCHSALERAGVRRANGDWFKLSPKITNVLIDFGFVGFVGAVKADPTNCETCGEPLPRTKRRSKAFGGRGRARRFCNGACRQRDLRRRRASTSRPPGRARRDVA